MRRSLTVLSAALLALAACATDGSTGAPSPTGPTPGPTLTVPGLGIEIDLDDFLECLADDGIEVEPESAPRFGADSEVRLSFQGQSAERVVVVFIFTSSDDAEAAREDVAGGEGAPQQVGNVLVTGLLEAVQDPDVTEQGGVVLACLGGLDIETGT